MRAFEIVLFSIALAVLYGILHDQVTVRLSPEYFTIGHSRIIESRDPTALAFAWGFVATWWMGLVLGILLALAARVGRWPKLTWADLWRPSLVLLASMAVIATVAGLVGRLLADRGAVVLVGNLAERVPADRHVAYLGALWAHLASYGAGTLGAVVLSIEILVRRRRLAREKA